MINTEIIERTVEGLRKRFWELLPDCGGPNRLAKRLSFHDFYFTTSDGIYDVMNAKKDKAGEVVMVKIVDTMQLLAKECAARKRMDIVDDSHRRLKKSQQESSARRAARLKDTQKRITK